MCNPIWKYKLFNHALNIQFQPPLNRYQVMALSEVLFIKYLLPETLHFL